VRGPGGGRPGLDDLEAPGWSPRWTGLKVTAVLDTSLYPKGIRIPRKDMNAFEARYLRRHEFHGNWNYTIPAQPPGDTTRPDHGK